MRTGLTERTVRFYAEEGLLKPATYEMNGRTYFDFKEADIKGLKNIAVLRKAGFSVEQILNMRKKPGTIKDTVSVLRSILEEQKNESEKSLDMICGIKADSITDIDTLADLFRNFTEVKKLPIADLEPDFGRFDMQSREEKQKAYREFIINSDRRGRRKIIMSLLAGALLLVGVSVYITLLAAGEFKGGTDGEIIAAADCLVGAYEDGDVELTFTDQTYKITAEGLHGGTLRMTRVYSDNAKSREISLSWSYFSEPENQMIKQAKLKTGAFEVQKGLGIAVVMVILPSETEDEYFAVYAESENMKAEELLDTVSGNVDVHCNWDVDYQP